VLAQAQLSSASFGDVDARRADLRWASMEGATWVVADLRGARLSRAHFAQTVFDDVVIDDATDVRGATGTILGSMRMDGDDAELRGPVLERHLRERGAELTVLAPRGRVRDA
jgi:uncharacterized protein YjbI with pentapeptide repeats